VADEKTPAQPQQPQAKPPQAQPQAPQDTSANPEAAKVEAILWLLLSAKTDEELAARRAQAEQVAGMSAEEVLTLAAGGDYEDGEEESAGAPDGAPAPRGAGPSGGVLQNLRRAW
jgi:hypothetical protein